MIFYARDMNTRYIHTHKHSTHPIFVVHPICKRAGVKNVHKYLSGEPYHHSYDNMEKGTIRWTLIKGVPSILNPPGPNLGNTCSMHTVGNTQSHRDICVPNNSTNNFIIYY